MGDMPKLRKQAYNDLMLLIKDYKTAPPIDEVTEVPTWKLIIVLDTLTNALKIENEQ